jgi:hypothetical protein
LRPVSHVASRGIFVYTSVRMLDASRRRIDNAAASLEEVRTPMLAGIPFRVWGGSDGGNCPVGVGTVPRRKKFRGRFRWMLDRQNADKARWSRVLPSARDCPGATRAGAFHWIPSATPDDLIESNARGSSLSETAPASDSRGGLFRLHHSAPSARLKCALSPLPAGRRPTLLTEFWGRPPALSLPFA